MLMFKNLLSLVTLFLFTFNINAGAQSIRAQKFNDAGLMPRYSAKQVITSKIDLKGGEYWNGYWNGVFDENSILLGVEQVPMEYDCAAMFPASSALVSGKTVEGIRFGFPNSTNISNVRVWLSTTLPVTPEEADIVCQEVKDITGSENEADELNEIRFETPYVIDPEKDLYVGYSFSVKQGSYDAEMFPIIVDSNKELANGLILKFGGAEGQWDDYNGYGFGVLAVQMLLSGEMYSDAASIHNALGTHVVTLGSSLEIPVVIENSGENALTSAVLAVNINGNTSMVDVKPEQPLEGVGTPYECKVKVNVPAESGAYLMSIKVDKVNGVDNPVKAAAKGNLLVVSRAVERKVLFEEFTGMWCGYCPRGTVAMQKLNQVYGDKISLVAVHVGDELMCYDYADITQNVGSFPASHINRKYTNVDPYFGLTNVPFDIQTLVDECLGGVPAAVVSASAVIDGDVLTATSQVEFLYTGDASNFAIGYIVTEDGLYDNAWKQSNYYSGSSPDGLVDEPFFDMWRLGGGKIAVEFNEVAIAARGILRGIEGSVPAMVEDGVKNSHSVEFNLKDYELIQNRNNLNLIAVLFDTSTGEVVNTCYVPLDDETNGIDGIETDEQSVETERYAADGRRILVPEKGVNIVKYSDGTVKKVVVR